MITVVVHDTPQPQGSKRAFNHKTTGKVVVVSQNSPGLKTWRGSVKDAAEKARGDRPPIEGPVILAVTFTLKKPVSAPKRRKVWPSKKPDLDKLLRSTMDALTAAGVYRDDAQVVELVRFGKFYPQTPAQFIPTEFEAKYMLSLAGTELDVLDTPGAVIRVAAIDEFPGVE